MTHALVLGAISLIVTVVAGWPTIWFLRQRNVSKEIYEYLRAPVEGSAGDAPTLAPERHAAKAGRPTMGGIFLLAGVLATKIGRASCRERV